jgi:hypothetical protein
MLSNQHTTKWIILKMNTMAPREKEGVAEAFLDISSAKPQIICQNLCIGQGEPDHPGQSVIRGANSLEKILYIRL